jgi:hypothetical protein
MVSVRIRRANVQRNGCPTPPWHRDQPSISSQFYHPSPAGTTGKASAAWMRRLSGLRTLASCLYLGTCCTVTSHCCLPNTLHGREPYSRISTRSNWRIGKYRANPSAPRDRSTSSGPLRADRTRSMSRTTRRHSQSSGLWPPRRNLKVGDRGRPRVAVPQGAQHRYHPRLPRLQPLYRFRHFHRRAVCSSPTSWRSTAGRRPVSCSALLGVGSFS